MARDSERAPAVSRYRVTTLPRYRIRGSTRTTFVAYLFLAPALALLAVFTFYPVIFGTILSLFEYDVINPPKYVGLVQFQRLLSDRYFWIAITNSAKYVLVVPVIQLGSILLAVLEIGRASCRERV